MTAMFEEIGEGYLRLTADGQGTDVFYTDPVVKRNRPPDTGWCDTSHLSHYEGTDLYQWWGRRSDGRFYPWGKILRKIAEPRE